MKKIIVILMIFCAVFLSSSVMALETAEIKNISNEIQVLQVENEYNEVIEGVADCSALGLLHKDLQGILNVIKWVAPILVVAMSVYDFIKAITGKVDGEAKKAFQKMLKRLIFAVILFFLPMILDYFLGLVDPSWETCLNN